MNTSQVNATTLEKELDWFNQVLETRFSLVFETDSAYETVYDIPAPVLNGDGSAYAGLVKEHEMTFDERIVLMLSLIPHVRPQALDLLFTRNSQLDRAYTEFGGCKGQTHGGFLPTCETASFILAGRDVEKRFEIIRLFEDEHFFARKGIIKVDHQSTGEPFFSGVLRLSADYLNLLTSGAQYKPDYSIDFPAKLITTNLTWDDLVLAPNVVEEIDNINTWIRHSQTILDDWGLKKSVKPGYRSLFYGPPGTGKTLSATLIGASAGVDVYRIDLSMVVSKFIGETEKNLANVFDQAQNKNWVLFFDEADALFGKRTQTSSSNDRYANQEISYLLQRVEDFPGVVILATNMKANIDDAFARRFQSFVYFPMPDAGQRLKLWESVLGTGCNLADDVDLEQLAEDTELSGGAITNVVRYGAIRALQRENAVICQADLLKGISKERMKEGKTS